MGRYYAQHLFLKGSSLILYTTGTSAGREKRRKHEERAEVNRIGQQMKETEGTKQGHPKNKHSPFALPRHNGAAKANSETQDPFARPVFLRSALQRHHRERHELSPCLLGKQSL